MQQQQPAVPVLPQQHQAVQQHQPGANVQQQRPHPGVPVVPQPPQADVEQQQPDVPPLEPGAEQPNGPIEEHGPDVPHPEPGAKQPNGPVANVQDGPGLQEDNVQQHQQQQEDSGQSEGEAEVKPPPAVGRRFFLLFKLFLEKDASIAATFANAGHGLDRTKLFSAFGTASLFLNLNDF